MPSLPGLLADRLREILRVLAVDDRLEHGLVRCEALALDRVAPVRDDVPRHRNGGHPVLADVSGRRRLARGDRRERTGAGDDERGAGKGRERERPRP